MSDVSPSPFVVLAFLPNNGSTMQKPESSVRIFLSIPDRILLRASNKYNVPYVLRF